MEEIWKDIPGADGYQASNLGMVKSLDRSYPNSLGIMRFYPGRILKPDTNIDGYYCVKTRLNGKLANYRVHRLVALAFIDNPENKATVNHINGIKRDNRIENLEWATIHENVKHSLDNKLQDWDKRRGENCYWRSQIIVNLETGIYYFGCPDAYKTGVIKYSYSNFANMSSGRYPNKTNFIKV